MRTVLQIEIWLVLQNEYDDLVGLWGFYTKQAADEFLKTMRPSDYYPGSPHGWQVTKVRIGSQHNALSNVDYEAILDA